MAISNNELNDAVGRAASTSRSRPSGFTGQWNRTWTAFCADVTRRMGLTSSMLAAGLGVSGLGGIEEKKAEAGIVSSFGNDADFRARGATYSVEGGGNVGSIAVTNVDTGSVVNSSLVFVNAYTAISAGHQYLSEFGTNQSYKVSLGANYNSGAIIIPQSITIHPLFGTSAGAGIDLAILKFTEPVPLQNNLVFATGTPLTGEDVWLAGYGRAGSRAIGELPQDGFIRAGTSRRFEDSSPLLGDPVNYRDVRFSDLASRPQAMRGASGDSGGGVFSADGEFYGLIIGGSSSLSGSTTVFLSTSLPSQRDFIDFHSTSVPEPSSLALLSAIGVGYLSSRRRKRTVRVVPIIR